MQQSLNPNTPFLPPEILPMTVGISQIFTVPAPDVVGTTQMSDGVSLIHLEKDKARVECLRKKISKDLFDQEGFYVKPFAESIIAFGQPRTLTFFNLKTLTYKHNWVVPSLNEDLKRVFPLLESPDKFVFEMNTPNFNIYDKNLWLYEFNKEDWDFLNQQKQGAGLDDKNNKKNFKVLKKVVLGDESLWKILPFRNSVFAFYSPTSVWDTNGTRTFAFGKCSIQCFDANLNASSHPIIDIFQKIRANVSCITDCSIHPTLPFGLIGTLYQSKPQIAKDESFDTYSSLWLLRWNHPDKQKRAIPLFNHLMSIYPSLKPKYIYAANESLNANTFRFCEFSADGSWMVFADASENEDNPTFYAFPVDEKFPLFIGKPIMLGKAFREDAIMQSTAWLTNKPTFVMSDGEILYVWDLTKAPRVSWPEP